MVDQKIISQWIWVPIKLNHWLVLQVDRAENFFLLFFNLETNYLAVKGLSGKVETACKAVARATAEPHT